MLIIVTVSLCGYSLIDNRLVVVLEPVMPRDLRRMIDDRARKINNEKCFDDSTARDLMKQIAANILVSENREGHIVVRITDIEIGENVVGAGFWRAPEILEALPRREAKSVPRIYTNKNDAYSSDML